MMSMNSRDVLDRNVIFKTRFGSCRIAVRAEIENVRHSTKKRTDFGANWMSFGTGRYRIEWFCHVELRFTDDCPQKTDDSQRSCGLRFPYGTGRRSTTGLLEQMPRSRDRRASARRVLIATSPLRAVRPHSRSQSLTSYAFCVRLVHAVREY